MGPYIDHGKDGGEFKTIIIHRRVSIFILFLGGLVFIPSRGGMWAVIQATGLPYSNSNDIQ